jgi:hypothetical protein
VLDRVAGLHHLGACRLGLLTGGNSTRPAQLPRLGLR